MFIPIVQLLLAFHANFTKKQSYQVSPVTYWFAFAHVLIRFWLKRKYYFTSYQSIYRLFHIEDFYHRVKRGAKRTLFEANMF